MNQKRWKCTVCGYIHEGENPPDVCPVCGVDASFFEPVENDEPPVRKLETTEKKEIAHGIKPALYKISYGMFVVTSEDGNKINGQCCNTVFQITSEPAQVAIGINKQNYTHQFIEASGKVGISVLGQKGHDMARNFGYSSGRDKDKFAGIAYDLGTTGVPLLKESIAFLEGRVVNKLDCGTHTLFLLEVVNGDLRADEEPMTYEYFRKTK